MIITKFNYLIVAIICLQAFYSCNSINPEPPTISEKDIPQIEQSASKIDIPITIELKDYIKYAETSISNVHSDSVQECQGIQYAYMLKRSPFNITGSGNTVNLSFQGKYWIKLSYCAKCNSNRCVVPKIGASCGIDEPMRAMNIAFTSTFNLEKNYRLHSTTSLASLEPLNKCRVTKFNINATDRLIGYVKGPLGELGTKVDERIASIDFRPRVDYLWKLISKEIQLGDLGYLSINPKGISVDSINLKGTVLNTNLGLIVSPVIMTESKQQPASPLPDMTNYKPGNGFKIYFDIHANYDSLAHILNKKIVGRKIQLREDELIITNSKIYGAGNQKVIIVVEFKGDRRGRIYFTGTPNYNTTTNVLTFPDLAFDSKTQNVLIEIKEWVYNDEITKRIRERAKFDFTNLVNKGKQKFEEGINRNLGKHVKLSGDVSDITIRAVYPAKSQLILRALSHGNMKLKIRK